MYFPQFLFPFKVTYFKRENVQATSGRRKFKALKVRANSEGGAMKDWEKVKVTHLESVGD